MTPLVFVVLVLAAYRATRLVVHDSLWEHTRDRLLDALQVRAQRGATFTAFTATKAHDLLSCPYCVGVWASAAAVGLAAWGNLVELSWQAAVLAVAAVAGGQALCSAIDGKLNEE